MSYDHVASRNVLKSRKASTMSMSSSSRNSAVVEVGGLDSASSTAMSPAHAPSAPQPSGNDTGAPVLARQVLVPEVHNCCNKQTKNHLEEVRIEDHDGDVHMRSMSMTDSEQSSADSCSTPYLPEEICREIADFAAPLADTIALVSKDWHAGAKHLRETKTCLLCGDKFRECDQAVGLGEKKSLLDRAGKGCLYHPGRIAQWTWDEEPQPGFQWTCCGAFTFDENGYEHGLMRYDEDALRARAALLPGCTAKKHRAKAPKKPRSLANYAWSATVACGENLLERTEFDLLFERSSRSAAASSPGSGNEI